MKQEREISLVRDMDIQTIKMEFIPAIVDLWAKNQGNTEKVVVLLIQKILLWRKEYKYCEIIRLLSFSETFSIF